MKFDDQQSDQHETIFDEQDNLGNLGDPVSEQMDLDNNYYQDILSSFSPDEEKNFNELFEYNDLEIQPSITPDEFQNSDLEPTPSESKTNLDDIEDLF